MFSFLAHYKKHLQQNHYQTNDRVHHNCRIAGWSV